MIKRTFKIFLIVMLLFSLSSCNMSGDNSLNKVKSSNKLKIGMMYNLGTIDVLDPDTGEAYGFDVDVANELCSRMGVKAEFVYLPWDLSSGNALSNSKADCIINGFDNTIERQAYYAMSVPYINNRKVFLTLFREDINATSDLQGKILGVHNESSCKYTLMLDDNANEDFRKFLSGIVFFEDYDEAIKMLKEDQVNAILIDELLARRYKNDQSGMFKFLVDQNGEPDYFFDAQCVVAFRREDLELRSEINKFLIEMFKDGTLSKLSIQWFGEDMTRIK